MTEHPSKSHLIERAAERLGEMAQGPISGLLQPPEAGSRREAGILASPPAPIGTGLLAGPPLAAEIRAGLRESQSVPQAQATEAPLPDSLDAETLKAAGMIDWTRSRERPAEEFRVVQAQLLQLMAARTTKPPAIDNLVMITSARPGEGKSFVSLNLAGSLSTGGQRPVILVDIDIKRRTLTKGLGLLPRPGLLDMATDPACRVEATLIGTSLPKLRILPVGLGAPDDSISGGRAIINVLERLGRLFPDHVILLDSPPCLSTSEPSTLAPVVGYVVMLVEAQQTQRAELEAALDLVEACPSVMLMLNKVQLTASDSFGAYGY